MKSQRYFAVGSVVVLLMVFACSVWEKEKPKGAPSRTPTITPDVQVNPAPTGAVTPTPADAWSALRQKTPFPYTTPLPPADPGALDGDYAAVDPIQGTRIPCRRCPPYPPEGGVWKLNLERGIYRILHPGSGWHSLGSFRALGERIELFNDPHCYNDVGVYTWKLTEGQLIFEVVDDECGKHLRRERFTKLPWSSCQPPSTEAVITDRWLVPPGCRGEND